MRHAWICALVALMACDADGPEFTDEMPDDLPAGTCRDTDAEDCETSTGSAPVGAGTSSGDTGTTTSGGPSDACSDSEGCLGGDTCAALWNPQTESRGPFACQFACVPLLDETAWCSDDAACCDAQAVCTPRGYCVLGDGPGASTGGTE